MPSNPSAHWVPLGGENRRHAGIAGHTKGTGRVTRHRAPDAPARRRSRRRSSRRASDSSVTQTGSIAQTIVAEALTAGALTTDALTPGAQTAAARHAAAEDGDAPRAATALLEREATADRAIVVQDTADHDPGVARVRGRRQLALSALSVLCVAGLVGLFVNVVDGGRGVDPTGFDVIADAPEPGDLPRSLVDPPSLDGPKPGRAAAPNVTGRGDDRGSGPVARGVSSLFGGANSPWVQPATGPVDPNSAAMVAGFSGEKFQMSTGMWTVPLYFADANTPRRNVPITSGWTEFSSLPNVPVPPNAKPDPSDDAHLTIVDRARGCVYDFWGASGSGSSLTAKLGNAMPIDSSGVDPGGLGARASGFSGAAGLVTYEDLKKGSIDHALVFAYPKTRSGGPVAPATKSDGRTGGSDAIPIGARVRLDPTLNLNSLGLNRYEMMIARALQKYGMILGDTSGGFTIYAQHPQSVPGGSYGGLLPDVTWVDLSKIPTNKFQVMKLGPQRENASRTVGNRCNGA